MDHEIGAGDVPITIDGKEYVLKPSLNACLTLSSGEGLQGMIRRIQSVEADAIVRVVSAGLGRNARDLPKLLYKTGLVTYVGPCIKYLSNLSNGGTPLRDDQLGEDQDVGELSQSTSTTSG